MLYMLHAYTHSRLLCWLGFHCDLLRFVMYLPSIRVRVPRAPSVGAFKRVRVLVKRLWSSHKKHFYVFAAASPGVYSRLTFCSHVPLPGVPLHCVHAS